MSGGGGGGEGGGKTIQVEMSTYLNTYDVDTMEVITASILPLQGHRRS